MMINQSTEEEGVSIYSPVALFWFSLVFGPLAGGIMAFQSLKEVGQISFARYVLWVSIGCFVLLWIINSSVLLGVVLGGAWGTGLWLLMKKRVPNEANFARRSVVKPLRICLYIMAAFIILTCLRMQLASL